MIVGRGRVGGSLARAVRAAGQQVRLVSGRGPAVLDGEALVVLCVPDAAVREVASRLRSTDVQRAIVHTAGMLDVDHLAELRARGWSVGQAHPLLAVATQRTVLAGGTLLVGGDPLAVRRARALARAIGMHPLVAPRLDRALWHAIAALVANGASALAAIGTRAWTGAGVSEPAARAALAALLASVARNVSALGTPAALTGPVRRGDAETVERHLAVLDEADPTGAVPRLYAALAAAQIDLASALGEADRGSLERIARATSRPFLPPSKRRGASRRRA